MKIRLTESQYNNLLKIIKPNKKLTITESQYKRLIVEANSQDVFSEIKSGQAFKINAGGKDFTFEVIDSNNGQLLVNNLNDGRYVNVYFFIDYNGIQNNNLITNISKAKAGPYSKIDGNLDKERLKSWKSFTFRNVTSFKVFENKLFNKNLFDIDTKTGKKIELKTNDDNEDSMDIDLERELRDNLIKGIEPNVSYELTFYDNSTIKFFVLNKQGSIIDIKFKTKSGKERMNYSDVSSEEAKRKELFINQQNKLISDLNRELKIENDPIKKQVIQDKIIKAKNLIDNYDSNQGRFEGLQTISRSDYTDGIASKWVETLENSVEFKYGKNIKIDLSKIKTYKGKIKVDNFKQNKEVTNLKEKLANTSDEKEKKEIQDKLKNIDKINTLHFLNPEFDIINTGIDEIVTFDLNLILEYKPEDISKKTKQGVEWSINTESKSYLKEFPLKGIKTLSVINDKSEPLLGGKELRKKREIDLNTLKTDLNNIYELTKNDINARNMILNRPNKLMQLLNLRKDKGIIPLEELQKNINTVVKSNTIFDKFITNNNVRFEIELKNLKVDSGLEEEFKIFRNLLKNGLIGIGKVKKYKEADKHIILNMQRKGENNKVIIYSLFIGRNISTDNKYDVFSTQLKVSYSSNKPKLLVADFNIKINKEDGYKVQVI